MHCSKHPLFLDLASLHRDDPEAVAGQFVEQALANPEMLEELASIHGMIDGRGVPEPFRSGLAPIQIPAPARRSVVFLGNSYYNFLYLAGALRRRGWDAISVNVEDDTRDGFLFHGQDLDLFDPEPDRFLGNVRRFYAGLAGRFRLLHFYGKGRMALFPENSGTGAVPWDFLALKRAGMRIAYSHYGCQDMVARSTFDRWSRNRCCPACVWSTRPDQCDDATSLAWGRRVKAVCDMICVETEPLLDHKHGPSVYQEPLTCALDPDLWRDDLEIPARFRRPREDGEVVVYHAVGNFDARVRDGRNVKGTHAVVAAIDALRQKGLKVRLDFVKDIPNREVRFIQAQADIIVDQVLYGRHGATAREAMMLGKPTVACIDAGEEFPGAACRYLENCPVVPATPATLADTLEDLVRSPERRVAIGRASRAHALQWWSADACAARYEAAYDRLMQGLPPAP